MQIILYVVLALLVAIAVASLVWRFSSEHRSLPCPFWLAWMLEFENPLFRNNSSKEIIVIADPHFQPRGAVIELAADAGFKEQSLYGNRFSFTMILEKPLKASS